MGNILFCLVRWEKRKPSGQSKKEHKTGLENCGHTGRYDLTYTTDQNESLSHSLRVPTSQEWPFDAPSHSQNISLASLPTGSTPGQQLQRSNTFSFLLSPLCATNTVSPSHPYFPGSCPHLATSILQTIAPSTCIVLLIL